VLNERFDVAIVLPALRAREVVPRSAVTVSDGVASVHVQSGLWYRTVPVSLGVSDDENVQVFGLAAGDVVFTQLLSR
jgi:hypothetical protein